MRLFKSATADKSRDKFRIVGKLRDISPFRPPSPLLMNIFRDELDTRRILLNASCEEM